MITTLKDLVAIVKEFNLFCTTDQQLKLGPINKVKKFSSRELKQLFNGQNSSKMECSFVLLAWQKWYFSHVYRTRIKLPGILFLQGVGLS